MKSPEKECRFRKCWLKEVPEVCKLCSLNPINIKTTNELESTSKKRFLLWEESLRQEGIKQGKEQEQKDQMEEINYAINKAKKAEQDKCIKVIKDWFNECDENDGSTIDNWALIGINDLKELISKIRSDTEKESK